MGIKLLGQKEGGQKLWAGKGGVSKREEAKEKWGGEALD